MVLDNLAAHRVPEAACLLRKAGAGVWDLPPYSPDLNPIEKIWAKVKAWLRKAAARTTEALWAAIGAALAAVTPEDCQGCIAACGYHATPVREALLSLGACRLLACPLSNLGRTNSGLSLRYGLHLQRCRLGHLC